MRSKVFQDNAPYLYLVKVDGETDYRLFIALRTPADYSVSSWGTPQHQAEGTLVDVQVAKKTGDPQAFEQKMILLDPGAGVDPATYRLKVTVTVTGDNQALEGEFATLMIYADADREQAGLPAKVINDEIAYNCPYVYLEKPNGKVSYTPFFLLAPDGCTLAPSKDVLNVTTPDNGILETLVALAPASPGTATGSFAPFFDPAAFNTHAAEYAETGEVEGNYLAMTVFFDTVNEAETFLNETALKRNELLFEMEHSGEGASGEGNGATPRGLSSDKKKKKAKTRNMH